MQDKDLFKSPKARHTGNNLFEQGKGMLDDFKDRSDLQNQEVPKTHSLTILPSYIDKMRDYVHHAKIHGNPYFTQGMLIQEALDLFFEKINIEIPERPKEVINAERRRTGRRKSKKAGSHDRNELGFE